LPAGQRVGPASTVKNDGTRSLNGTDSSPSGQQRPGGKHGNQKNNDHFVAHRRRDYTTSYVGKTLTVCFVMKNYFWAGDFCKFSLLICENELWVCSLLWLK
jgi:hypothetical protein